METEIQKQISHIYINYVFVVHTLFLALAYLILRVRRCSGVDGTTNKSTCTAHVFWHRSIRHFSECSTDFSIYYPTILRLLVHYYGSLSVPLRICLLHVHVCKFEGSYYIHMCKHTNLYKEAHVPAYIFMNSYASVCACICIPVCLLMYLTICMHIQSKCVKYIKKKNIMHILT